ncbi:MAG: hypothetical protein ACI4JW_03685 [Oscillospiraceae bacterium]
MKKKIIKNYIVIPLMIIIAALLVLSHLFIIKMDIDIHIKDNYSHTCQVNDLIVYLDSDGIYCSNSNGDTDKIYNINITKTSTVTADHEFVFFSSSVDSKKIVQIDYSGNVLKTYNISHDIHDMYFVDDILYVLYYSDADMRYDIKAYSSVDDMKIIDLDNHRYDYNINLEKDNYAANFQIINNCNHYYLKATDKNGKTIFCNVYNKENAKQIFLSVTNIAVSLYENKLVLLPLKAGKLNHSYIINIDDGKIIEADTAFNIDYSYQPIKQFDEYIIIATQYPHLAKGFSDNISEQVEGDNIIIWDYKSLQPEEKKTKNHERIIYFDEKVIITYCDKKFITYRLTLGKC